MLDGFIVLDKDQGISSFGLLKKLKKQLYGQKIGHTGTLDPMATGVLCVAVGKATGFINFLPNEKKHYIAEFRLGIKTDTQDITGKIIEEKDVKNIDFTELQKEAETFMGEIFQTPPMYSAVSVGGKKLYKLAREGKEIERKKRKIKIFSFNLEKIDEINYKADIVCSPGTYIRTLINDLGEKLGTYATITSLRRTFSDGFSIEDATKIDDIDNIDNLIIPIDEKLDIENKIKLDKEFAKKFVNGNTFKIQKNDGVYLVYSKDFLGVGEINKNKLRAVKVYEETKKNVLALGNFDGVHEGHKDVLNTAINLSKKINANPFAVYFKEHPAQVLKTKNFSVLMTEKQKSEFIKNMGLNIKRLDFNIVKDFSPEEFFEEILIHKFNAAGIVCGENYTFGKAKSGDTKLLRKLCEEKGISVEIISLDEFEHRPISSTRIKEDLSLGDIESANKMLGRPFSFISKVVKGSGIGNKTLGYPTINQYFSKYIFVPKNGVYESYVVIDGKKYSSVTNIGCHPTVGKGKKRAETHILNFDGNLYNQEVEVFLLKFLRDEIQFKDISELQEQIKRDIESLSSK